MKRLAALFLALSAPAAACARSEFAAEVEGGAEIDLGTLEVSEKPIREVAFTIRNAGTRELRMTGIQSTCGCAAARLVPETIAVGATARLELTITLVEGKTTSSTTSVFFASAARPVQVSVRAFKRGSFSPQWTPAGDTIEFSTGAQDTGIHGDLRVDLAALDDANSPASELDVTSVKWSKASLEVTSRRLDTGGPGVGTFLLRLAPKEEDDAARVYDGVLTVGVTSRQWSGVFARALRVRFPRRLRARPAAIGPLREGLASIGPVVVVEGCEERPVARRVVVARLPSWLRVESSDASEGGVRFEFGCTRTPGSAAGSMVGEVEFRDPDDPLARLSVPVRY